jgi:hypothetical protein
MRWRLEQDLGYQTTLDFQVTNTSGNGIFDMIFATDHWAGEKIMTGLYSAVLRRRPALRQKAQLQRRQDREEARGVHGLFDLTLVDRFARCGRHRFPHRARAAPTSSPVSSARLTSRAVAGDGHSPRARSSARPPRPPWLPCCRRLAGGSGHYCPRRRETTILKCRWLSQGIRGGDGDLIAAVAAGRRRPADDCGPVPVIGEGQAAGQRLPGWVGSVGEARRPQQSGQSHWPTEGLPHQ